MGKSVQIKNKGFTLIELMVVVAVIGTIASVAVPKMTSSIAKSREGAIKSDLGTIRSAVNIYYSDLEGMYPTTIINSLDVQRKYIKKIPPVQIPPVSSSGFQGHSEIQGETIVFDDMTTGGWVYNLNGPLRGRVYVNCTHADSKGTPWSYY